MNQFYALLIGFLITCMLIANGHLQNSYGPALSLVIIHGVGSVVLIIMLFLSQSKIKFKKKVPWYIFSSGSLGVLLIFINNTTMARIGLTMTIALGMIGQIIVSALIDHLGLFGLSKRKNDYRKLFGYGIIAIGIAVMAWPRS